MRNYELILLIKNKKNMENLTVEKLKFYYERRGFRTSESPIPGYNVLGKLSRRELPKMVWLVKEAVPALKEERIAETKKVFAVAAENDLSPLLTLALMDLSVGKDYSLENEVYRIVGHYVSNKEGREELWNTEWELPVRLAAGMIRDMRDDIDLENPTRWDLRHSQTFAVARVFIDKKDTDADFSAARDRQNKEIDKFISKWPIKTTGEQKTRICLQKAAEAREAKRCKQEAEAERREEEAKAKRRKKGLFTAAELFSIATGRIISGVEYEDTYDDLGNALRRAGYTEGSVPERLLAYAEEHGFSKGLKEAGDKLASWSKKSWWVCWWSDISGKVKELCSEYQVPETIQF